MAIMCLCLMVYGFSQHKLRKALQITGETVPSQTKKETSKPRMQWIYRLFQGVHVLSIKAKSFFQELVINLDALLKRVVCFFGRRAMEIYGLSLRSP